MNSANRSVSINESAIVEKAKPPLPSSLLFALGVLAPFYLTVENRIYPSELILGALLPILIVGLTRRGDRTALLLTLVGAAWLIVQLLTDWYRLVPLSRSLPGVLNIAFFLVDLLVLRWALITDRSRALFAIGLALGGLSATVLQPGELFSEAAWKFGYATPVTILVVVLVIKTGIGRKGVAATLVVLAVVHTALDYRSLAGMCLVASIVVMRRSRPRSGSTGKAFRLAFSLVLVGTLGFLAYSDLADSGNLGTSAQQRYQSQAAGAYGLMVGGRKEMVALGFAISDSPLIGSGSRGGLTTDEYSRTVQFFNKAGYILYPPDVAYLTQDPFPAHSVILGAWYAAGLIGLTFWLVVLALLARGALRSIRGTTPVYVWLAGSSAIWAILFSPLAADARLMLAFTIVLVLSSPSVRDGTVRLTV